MKKTMKKAAIALTTTAVVIACIPNGAVCAAEITRPTISTTISSTIIEDNVVEKNGNYFLTLGQNTRNYLKTLTESGVLREVSMNDTGEMILLNNDNEYLKITYGISDEFITLFKEIIQDSNSKGVLQGSQEQLEVSLPAQYTQSTGTQLGSNEMSTMMFLENSKIYFDQADIDMYFFAAASIGPYALSAALSSLAFLIGGPVGTIITGALTIIGIGTLTNLCYLIIQAKVNKKNGIYIGLNWDGWFPNYTQGTW